MLGMVCPPFTLKDSEACMSFYTTGIIISFRSHLFLTAKVNQEFTGTRRGMDSRWMGKHFSVGFGFPYLTNYNG